MNLNNFRRAVMALVLAACASLASAAGTLTVELDTTGYGSDGWIDIQLNSSPLGNVTTYAELSNIIGFGSADGSYLSNASGSVATGFTIENVAGGYNDLFYAVDYTGGKISFTVSFSGDADPSGLYGSVFSVALYGADGFTPVGNSSNADGSLVHLNWTPATTVGGVGSVATEVLGSGVAVTAVPEPSSWAMLVGGLALLGFMRRRRQA